MKSSKEKKKKEKKGQKQRLTFQFHQDVKDFTVAFF